MLGHFGPKPSRPKLILYLLQLLTFDQILIKVCKSLLKIIITNRNKMFIYLSFPLFLTKDLITLICIQGGGHVYLFLAHLSRRLTAALIGYPWSGVRPSFVRPQFQRSSPLKPLGQSKPNFMWSLLGKGERKFI